MARRERDPLGEREVPEAAYWGIQTLRAIDNFPISGLGPHADLVDATMLVKQAAETFRDQNVLPFAVYCSDPCDGRSQGTIGMFDSLPYRNDGAIAMRRMIRSLPTRDGVMGVATCDKGLPAMLMARTRKR